LEKRQVDLARLIAGTVKANNIMAQKKNIQIDFSIMNWVERPGDMTPWEVVEANRSHCSMFKVDPLRMEQVVNNLLSNAIKFSYPGSKIQVVGEKKDSEGLVEISIIDQGQGIPPDDMKNLFTPFSRLSVKPTAGEGSTGLGLCIIKHIIEAHGGNIIVESTVGKGTKFKIILSLIATPMSRCQKNVPTEMGTIGSDAKMRILLADDNTITKSLVKQVLTKRGHVVDVASDGVQALDIYQRGEGKNRYDLLLIDEEMPLMNGSEVIEKIRSSDTLIPIISISGNATEDHKKVMRTVGANMCLPKPFQIVKLINAVEQFSRSRK